MTVINHKSISGITSITAPAGSDDLLTVHTNDTTERFRIVDSGAIVTGVTTASNFKTGTTNVHNVGVELAGINVLGADTPIGTGATIYNSGAAVFTGVVTATGLSVTGSVDSIKASNNYFLIGSSNAGGASLVLDGDSNGDGGGTDYAYIEHDTSGNLNIVGDNPANAANIIFKTNSSTERLRIASDGNVTIGNDGDSGGAPSA